MPNPTMDHSSLLLTLIGDLKTSVDLIDEARYAIRKGRREDMDDAKWALMTTGDKLEYVLSVIKEVLKEI